MRALGITDDEDRTLFALVEKKGKKKKILRLFSETKSKKNDFSSAFYASCLPMQDTLFYPLQLQVKTRSQLKKALPFHLQSSCPIEVQKSLIASTQIQKETNGFNLTLHVVDKEILQKHLKEKRMLGIELDHTTAESQALFRFSEFFFPKENCLLHLHLKHKETLCLVTKDGFILGSHIISMGWSSFTKTQNQKSSLPKKELELWKKEVQKVLFCHEKKLASHLAILITGPASEVEVIQSSHIFSNISTILCAPSKELSPYALSIGAALDALTFDEAQVQFLQEEFFPKKSKRQLFTKIGLYSLIAFSLFCTVSLVATKHWNTKAEELRKSFFIELKKDPTFHFEATCDPLYLNLVEKKLANDKATSLPCLCPLFSMSELFTWLQSFEGFLKKGELHLEQFHYELTQYPRKEKPHAPFEGKIFFIISAKETSVLNSFQKFLLADKIHIDQTKKILWTPKENGCVHVEFFIKNRPQEKAS